MTDHHLNAGLLRRILHYCPQSGVFVWAVPAAKRIKVGSVAGSLHGQGYLHIRINGRAYKAHRLAWLYVYGRWPNAQIDHVNGKRDDNRLCNLRECTNSENSQNRRAARGVFKTKHGSWEAYIGLHGKRHYLGNFTSEPLALSARAAVKELHPFNTLVQ